MDYKLENGIWSSVFAVPCKLADEHIKLCSALSLKVLMLILRHNGSISIEKLSEILNQSETDIQDALNYWIHSGFLVADDKPKQATKADNIQTEPVSRTSNLEKLPVNDIKESEENETAPAFKKITSQRNRLTTGEINQMASQDENISFILQESQSILGKPLTPVATDTLVALYSYYGMSPDLILMLITYCVSIGKCNMRYIEAVAVSWIEQEIDTHEKAEREILRQTEKQSLEHKIKTAFGIKDRGLVSSEKKYIYTWFEEYKMDIPIMTLAYERCVEFKGKLSFSYINGILKNWHSKGIRTPQDAVKEINSAKQQNLSKKQSASSYDIDELEHMINHSSI